MRKLSGIRYHPRSKWNRWWRTCQSYLIFLYFLLQTSNLEIFVAHKFEKTTVYILKLPHLVQQILYLPTREFWQKLKEAKALVILQNNWSSHKKKHPLSCQYLNLVKTHLLFKVPACTSMSSWGTLTLPFAAPFFSLLFSCFLCSSCFITNWTWSRKLSRPSSLSMVYSEESNTLLLKRSDSRSNF